MWLLKIYFYFFLAVLGGLFSSLGERALLSSRSAWAPHCGSVPCCGARALGRAGFSSGGTWLGSCGPQALKHRLSVTQGLVAPWPMGWDLPRSGIEACLLNWQADSLSLSCPGSPHCSFNLYFLSYGNKDLSLYFRGIALPAQILCPFFDWVAALQHYPFVGSFCLPVSHILKCG